MARRKESAQGPSSEAAGGLPADVVFYRTEVRGQLCPESVGSWLSDRVAWRERHPDQPLPRMSSLHRACLMRYSERGLLDQTLYRAGA